MVGAPVMSAGGSGPRVSEFDKIAHATTILGDLHRLAVVYAMSSSLESPGQQALRPEDFFSWFESVFWPMESTLDRLSSEGAFLIDIARTIGDDGFAAALDLVDLDDAPAVAALRSSTASAGSAVGFFENRLAFFDDSMSGALAALRSDRQTLRTGAAKIQMDWPHLTRSAAGLGLVVAGAFVVWCGLARAIPSALVLGAEEIVIGAGMAMNERVSDA